MIRKIVAFVLMLACLMGCFAGCGDAVSDITDSVLSAAKTELENQVKAKIQEYKVEVVETKTVFGQLNDEGKHQFYCAILIKTNAESSAEDCANGVGKLFGTSGYVKQTGSQVESEYLVKKTVTYNQTDFSEDNYYTVYVYVADMTKVIDFSKFTTDNT